ncbi:MAG: hypothetical protein HY956_10785, partial [Deltaproteobacteria bacterium]|nr:hypothetical protein [Deltaproteobacteria bacterium]
RPAREKRETVDLSSIITGTVTLFRNSPEGSSISVRTDVRDGVFVKGDQRQLGQVFWNLFLNAAHAMEGGGALAVSSRVDWAAEPEGRCPFAVVEVADTGKGMSADLLDRIFDPFFSTKDFGTGLGLAIVHRIVESHGGTISVASAVGSGTVFTIRIPVETQGALN